MRLRTDGRHADHYIPRTYQSGDKKDPKSYLLTYSDPQTCVRGKMFAPLYSTLFYLRFDMQHDCLYKTDFGPFAPPPPLPAPARPCPKGLHQNSECVPPVLIHRAVACESFKILA